ncbi:NAD(P)H-quinone oxidoreductase [Amphibiibacter pelophylacis]|uniref:NAD(P)H-quinone oxidoreductase n=1 Tax=Amphibiibacter pelophylacis TaxID=1799477 RepID=A0ACC6P1Z8_9BURK
MNTDFISYMDHGAGGPPEVLHTATRPRQTPQGQQVEIAVAFAGVNRPDVLQRSGLYPPPPGASPHLGLEVSGRIVAVGDGVQRWRVGDRVCALTPGGGYASHVLADERHCLPVPDGMDLRHAAALPETFFTVWTNVFERAHLRPGERLLVKGGSGGIGQTAIALGAAFGAEVWATAGSAAKAQACREAGAQHVILYRETDFVDAITTGTGGAGVDVILDMVGGADIARHLRCLALEGRLVQIAFLEGSRAEIDLMPVMLKRLTLTGSTLRPRSDDDKAAIARALEERVWPLLAQGRGLPRIDAEFPLAEAAKAHTLMESGAHIGKIVLRVGDGD